jgi:hypothetical protein
MVALICATESRARMVTTSKAIVKRVQIFGNCVRAICHRQLFSDHNFAHAETRGRRAPATLPGSHQWRRYHNPEKRGKRDCRMKKIQIILVRGGLVLLGMLLWLAFHAMTQH